MKHCRFCRLSFAICRLPLAATFWRSSLFYLLFCRHSFKMKQTNDKSNKKKPKHIPRASKFKSTYHSNQSPFTSFKPIIVLSDENPHRSLCLCKIPTHHKSKQTTFIQKSRKKTYLYWTVKWLYMYRLSKELTIIRLMSINKSRGCLYVTPNLKSFIF